MAKNLIPEIAKMLGVELDEDFNIKDKHGELVSDKTYKFSKNALLYYYQDDDIYYTASRTTLQSLLNGKYEIVKLPWKPKKGEKYWGFWYSSVNDAWLVLLYTWANNSADFAFYKAGWVYRTEKEAQAALPAVAAEIGVECEL